MTDQIINCASVSSSKEIRDGTRQKETSLTSAGIETTTSGFHHRCSID